MADNGPIASINQRKKRYEIGLLLLVAGLLCLFWVAVFTPKLPQDSDASRPSIFRQIEPFRTILSCIAPPPPTINCIFQSITMTASSGRN